MTAVAENRSLRRSFKARMRHEVNEDLRRQRADRERLTAELEREAAAVYRGEGARERARDLDRLIALTDEGIRLAEAALRYLD